MGSKTLIGCTSCVKKKLFGEAGLSMLLGWFSISSFIINPFLITWNTIQGLTVRPKPQEVNATLNKLGIPSSPQSVNLTQVGYSLASAMIKADGKVDEKEIMIAELIGMKIFSDFDSNAFRNILNSQNIPTIQSLTQLLKSVLNEEGKILIYKYLSAIAAADGHVDTKEKNLLQQVANELELNATNIAQATQAA